MAETMTQEGPEQVAGTTPTVAAPSPKAAPSGQTPQQEDLRLRERQEGWAVPLDRIEAFTMGAAISVEPDRIEAELMALWRKATERARESGARFAVARACLWNFIVHSDGEEEYRRTKQLLDEVSETVPARILSLHETWDNHSGTTSDTGSVVGDDGAPLRAYVEANYRRASGGRREVVAEEITLEASRLHGQRLPGLVRGLLLGDVPTALMVRNPAADSHWLPSLAREVDRFIFDSGKLDTGLGLLRVQTVLARLFPEVEAGKSASVEITDLGWLRLWPWRTLLASLFDTPQASTALRQLDQIIIEYVPGAEPAALLTAGWLMGRLRLTIADSGAEAAAAATTTTTDGQRVGTYTLSSSLGQPRGSAKRQVQLQLRETAPHPTPVGIACVTLRSGEQTFVAKGQSALGTLCVELHSPQFPPRMQPVQGRKDAELVIAAMGVGGRDPLMYEALRLGARLCRASEAKHLGAGSSHQGSSR